MRRMPTTGLLGDDEVRSQRAPERPAMGMGLGKVIGHGMGLEKLPAVTSQFCVSILWVLDFNGAGPVTGMNIALALSIPVTVISMRVPITNNGCLRNSRRRFSLEKVGGQD